METRLSALQPVSTSRSLSVILRRTSDARRSCRRSSQLSIYISQVMCCSDASVSAERKKRKMSSGRVGGASLVLLLLIVVSVCAAGGRGLAEEKIQKIQEHHNAASKDGTTAPGSHPRNLMVKTNDYGRYDPTPAFSRPHFKPIPH